MVERGKQSGLPRRKVRTGGLLVRVEVGLKAALSAMGYECVRKPHTHARTGRSGGASDQTPRDKMW